MKRKVPGPRFAICVSNRGYPVSLVVRKVYEVLVDDVAAQHRLLRVVDETREDYLFPARLFAIVDLPETVGRRLRAAR